MAQRGEFFARPWDSQPQEVAQPSPDIGWYGLWVGGDPRSLVNGRSDGALNITRSIGREGPAFDVPGSGATSAYLLRPGDLPTQGCTVVMLGAQSGSNNAGHFGEDSGGGGSRLGAHIPFGPDGRVYWDFGGLTEGATRLSVGSLSFAESDVWVFTTGARGMEIWQNGILRASNGANPTRSNSGVASWGIQANGTGGSNAGPARWYGVGFVNRQIDAATASDMSRSHAAFYSRAFAPRRIWVPVAAAGPSGIPVLSAATFVPGSTTATGFRPRVTITF